MTTPSVTHTFVNGTTASGTEVNTNLQNLIDAMTDGAKDFTIFTLTCGSTATFNGNVTLGNSSSDDLTITASLASSIAIKTTNTYNVGSSTLGLASIYFGANSQTVRVLGSGSMSATWTLTLPVSAGTAGFGLQTNGSGVTSWQPMQTDMSAVSSANYTVLDSDGFRELLVTTGASDRTMTLPTAADNTDRQLVIKKVDSGAGTVIIAGEGTEKIDGESTIVLHSQYEQVTIKCDGSAWHIIQCYIPTAVTASGTGAAATDGGYVDLCQVSLTKGTWMISATAHGTGGDGNQIGLAFTTTADSTTGTTEGITHMGCYTNGTNRMNVTMPPYILALASTTTYYLNAATYNNTGSDACHGHIVAKKIGYKST